jgi:hypothetical protein
VRLARLEEGQYLKQLDDMITDLTSTFSSSLHICNTLRERHQQYNAGLRRRTPPQLRESNRLCPDIVSEGFRDKIAELKHYRLQAESLRSKVRSAANLVILAARFVLGHSNAARLPAFSNWTTEMP